MKKSAMAVLVFMVVFVSHLVFAGDIDSPGPPSEGSKMPSLLNIYDYLNSGTLWTDPGSFQEPVAGPGSTMKSTKDIYDDIKTRFDQCDAGVSDVAETKKFFSTQQGNWGVKTGTGLISTGDASAGDVLTGKTFSNSSSAGLTGTMTNNGAGKTITPGTTDQAIAAGYWSSANTVSGDTDLVTGNIRSGVTIFGVSGNSNVVNTSSGDAVAGDILTGKKAWVDGSQVTGDVTAGSNVSGADGLKTFTIPNGLYSGSKTATANDSDLTEANIKDDVVIFGVTGTFPNDGNATTGEVKTGSTFYTNTATKLTGTGTKALSDANDTVNAGYYEATTLSAVDTDLTAANIKKDVDIFGKVGTYEGTGGGSAAVAKTGQTTSYATGDDGDLEKGVAWPNPRFTDNSDGTVTDNLTGLIWLKDANAFGQRDWATALTNCNTLNSGEHGLTDGSVEGDWRLPNRKELDSLIDLGQSNPALPSGHLFTNVQSNVYWSSTTYESHTDYAWIVYMDVGNVSGGDKGSDYYVWPVRSGN